VWGYLTGGEEEQQRVGSGSSGSPSRWAHNHLEVLYFPELDHATVSDARADRAGGAFSVRAAGLGFGHKSGDNSSREWYCMWDVIGLLGYIHICAYPLATS